MQVPPFLPQPLALAASSFCVSFLFLQYRQSLHASLSLPPWRVPRVPASPPLPPRKSTAFGAPTLGQGRGHCPGRAPPPLAASAAAPRASAFPYLTWTNACRQSQEFRPLTSASSSQGTARETEGRGWGRWGGRRGKGTNQQPLQPCRSFTFCLWVRSRALRELSRDK